MTDSSHMDFSPFDPLSNLEAVCAVVKAMRHLSWSYAGDIVRMVHKIGQTFYAGRCLVCVCVDGEKVQVYEYTDGSCDSLKTYFETADGQKFLQLCLELGPDCIPLTESWEGEAEPLLDPAAKKKLARAVKSIAPELKNPSSYVFPLRHQYSPRHIVKPGLLIMQEPRGLARWNQRVVDSVVVVAEYLAMVIECERLNSCLQEKHE